MDEEETTRSSRNIYTPAPPLARSRYNRQLLIPSISLTGQERISSIRVLIIGLGGLGSPAALYLAGAGVHTLGLLDHDIVEESNLHRQIAHRESSVYVDRRPSSGSFQPMTKVQSALRACCELNSTINYEAHETRLNGSNALAIVAQYDVVLDCTDNPATRYLISDVCVLLGKVFVSGAAQRLDGQVMVLNYPLPSGSAQADQLAKAQRGPCYRCVFPVPPSPEMVQGCSEIGILGPVVGTIGCLMASEAIRLMCRPDEVRKPTMLLYNAWSADPRGTFRTIGLRGRRQDCLSCGDERVLTEKGKDKLDAKRIQEGTMDYDKFCGIVEDVRLLEDEQRINAQTFLHTLQDPNNSVLVVDVREPLEIELGAKINDSINISISTILRGDASNKRDTQDQADSTAWDSLLDRSNDAPIYFVCQKGNDSQMAARKLIERQQEQRNKTRWIGDVKGGFIAIENYTSGR